MEKPNLLLVDDCAIMCKFYTLFLSKKYNTQTCTDPLAALTLVQNGFKPDLIVSDLNMPMLNGVGLILSIRKFLPKTPILVVSVNTGLGKAQAMEAGATDFLAKPVDPAQLSEAIGRLLKSGKVPAWKRLLGRA